MFTIHALPAQQGDCLWIEYGSKAAPRRILIDGGTPPTFDFLRSRIEALDPDDRVFELLIVTHIDTDHIGGILRLLDDPPDKLVFNDVWFNGWPQIELLTEDPVLGAPQAVSAEAILGPIDGEILDRLLELKLDTVVRGHNKAFGGAAAMISDSGPLPAFEIEGMKLTLLAPDRTRLARLHDAWVDVIREAGRDEAEIAAEVSEGAKRRGLETLLGPLAIDVRAEAAKRFKGEHKPANGSSIVVLAEYDGRCALLTGDSFAPVIEAGIRRVLPPGVAKLQVDVLKLPHHGSKNNTRIAMLERLDCQRFIVSSSGAIFGHPDIETLARVIVASGPNVELRFNYRVETTTQWNDDALKDDPEFPFTARFPKSRTSGIATVV